MFHAQRFTFTTLLLTICLINTGGKAALAGDASQMQPYAVFVAEDKAYTRCGPSAEYYRTDPLKHGQQLEVYAETDDGWLGVRPPQDSFCWVPSETVELDGNGEMGSVIEDKTVAWIGTHLGRARKYLWQVQLAEGESVTVIGRQERDGPDGPQLWLRIVPPSGEFRWIHQNQTVGTSEELVETMAARNQSLAENNVQFQPAGPTHVDRQPKAARLAADVQPEPASSRRRVNADAAAVADSGQSVMVDNNDRKNFDTPSERPIGSGAQSFDNESIELPPSLVSSGGPIAKPRPAAATASLPRPRGLLASMAKLGQPKIRDITTKNDSPDQVASADAATGSTIDSSIASDDNWVSGAATRTAKDPNAVAINAAPMTLPARPSVGGESFGSSSDAFVQTHQTSNQVAQVSGIAPLPAQNLVPAKTPTPSQAVVPAQAFASVEAFAPAQAIVPAQAALAAPSPTNSFNARLAPAAAAPQLRPPTFVSADRINELKQQVVGADLGSMRLVLSQLMSSQSSAAEARVVAEASRSLAARSTDPTIAENARVLSRRADQYAGLADRRDGPSVVQATTQSAVNLVGQSAGQSTGLQPISSTAISTPISTAISTPISTPISASIPANSGVGVITGGAPTLTPTPQPETNHVSYSGQLVQVYSARTHSPPFALTDGTGRTVAYVTPSPGINLRMHLNQQVSVTGTPGFVSGLNMPHVMALRADR